MDLTTISLPVSGRPKQNADEASKINMSVPLPGRVLALWSVILITTVFIVVRADNESQWNYFVIFVPVLVYDGILMLVVVSRIVRHSRRRFHDNEQSVKRKFWFLLLLVLNFIFICLLSSKLDTHVSFSWHYIFMVLWLLLLLVLADTTRYLKKELDR